MIKQVDLPKISDEYLVTVANDLAALQIGFKWSLEDESAKRSPTGDDRPVRIKGRKFHPIFEAYTKDGEKVLGKYVLKLSRTEYPETKLSTVAEAKDFIASLSTVGKNKAKTHRILKSLFKMYKLMDNHVGESKYGESRLLNVDKFTIDEIDSVSFFSGSYEETEFDIRVFEDKLRELANQITDNTKYKLGVYKEFTSIKFKELSKDEKKSSTTSS